MYVIIGQGAAGSAAAVRLRELDPQAKITIITDESDYFYSRIDLPDIIAGKYPAERSTLRDAAGFESLGITCRMGQSVAGIDTTGKTVELSSGERVAYDQLLLATGSLPVIPPLRGIGLAGVHALWTMYQAQLISEAAANGQSAIVIGAGLIGLKTALALKARGLRVTVVERMPRVLPRQLDEAASAIVEQALREQGIELMLGQEVKAFEGVAGKVCNVVLQNQCLLCDLAVVAVGVRPNLELAKPAGLNINRGVLVDRSLQTSAPGIYAAGDVVEVVDRLTGESVVPAIWPAAVEQGEIAAANMVGGKEEYTGSLAMNSVEIAGIPLVSVGDIFGAEEDQVLTRQQGNTYRRLVLRDGLLQGVLLVGDIRHAGVFTGLIERQFPVNPEQLLRQPSFPDLLAL